ncbi:hypothetical protein [Cutibacterium granulosum]|uniref:hypothetical protein n=1 Tax=Cutibacterium granulosum TaxID=33011 RepID=UPI002B236F6D|nr:hypothetical protein [Cutibacterium granulosum]
MRAPTASAVVAIGFMSSTAHTIVTNHPVTKARGCDKRDDVEDDVGRSGIDLGLPRHDPVRDVGAGSTGTTPAWVGHGALVRGGGTAWQRWCHDLGCVKVLTMGIIESRAVIRQFFRRLWTTPSPCDTCLWTA